MSLKISNSQAWRLVVRTVTSWHNDYAQSMGAALAFYTMFSVAPLVLIVISVAGYFFGASAARAEIMTQLGNLMGSQGAVAVEGLVASVNEPSKRSVAAGLGVIIFLVGATSVFNELQASLNRIWRAPRTHSKGGFFSLLRSRLLSFGLILAISFLLMVSLIVSAGMAVLGKIWGPSSTGWEIAAQSVDVLLTFILTTLLFAMIYKIIPQATVRWRDVWVGSGTTSALFTIGKTLIGIYLGHSRVVTAFGAVGSLAVCLLWVYYSAQVFLLGAEFTWIYSSTFGGAAPASVRAMAKRETAAWTEHRSVPARSRPDPQKAENKAETRP
jgi:membrane protein